MPGTIAALPPPVSFHDESRGIRRGLRNRGLVAPAPRLLSPWSGAATTRWRNATPSTSVKRGQEVLVIFPEGEIYYLNDLVQPFKSGVVDIGMQAVVEAQARRSPIGPPTWSRWPSSTAIASPFDPDPGAKDSLDGAASLPPHSADSLPRRLALIMAELLHRQEMIHHLDARPGSPRRAERARAGGAAGGPHANGRGLRGRGRQPRGPDDGSHLAAQLLLAELAETGAAIQRTKVARGSASTWRRSKHVAQMGGWQPQYVDLDPSQERLAEMVLKLEREVYGIKRPRQLANRDVFLKHRRTDRPRAIRRLISRRCHRRFAMASLNSSAT